MKKIILTTTFLCIVFFSCTNNTSIQKTNSTLEKGEIHTLLNNWHKAAAEANFENYFNAMDSVAVFVGTDASEVWNKKQFKDFSKPHFDKGKAWNFKMVDRNIYVKSSNTIACFNELLDTWMGVCRGSGVVERKKDGNWKISHYVLSITVPNEDIQPIIAIKKNRDSLFLVNFKK